jgi:hypothetical protein
VFVSPGRIVRLTPNAGAGAMYELSASAAVLGSDGDPVFDDRGRLFALSRPGGVLPLGIPVRQAPETLRLERQPDSNTSTN